ncbi:MAG: OmpH family outer membrane protein, partial [Planctomycetes bacterium]|nr:OmpH family outer membrane protein [Planctomycetota bacterium]
IQNYRQQAKQISAEVAQRKGFDVVLTRNDSVVLTYTPGADITQEVARQLKGRLETEGLRSKAGKVSP